MKKKNTTIPAVSKLNLLRQICNFIPDFLVSPLARATGAQDKARTFSPWRHLVGSTYAQLAHSIGLNDVRPAAMAEKLFWAVFEHVGQRSPNFLGGPGGGRFARKFKRTIHLVDSTTIPRSE